ncbi:MAG: dipeptide epimerase [Thermoplasmata archaeon]|nr:dipeptide epimerase [Thermoplasmata archaeon]
MKIDNFEIYPLKIPLKVPFVISAGAQYSYEGVLVKLTADDGTVGWGESSPSERVTGETPETVAKVLDTKLKPKLIGEEALGLNRVLNSVEGSVQDNSSARAAVDIALYDLFTKSTNIQLKDFIGGYRDELETCFTVVIGSVEQSVKDAQRLIEEEHFKILKVKIGVEPDEDVARIMAIRDAVGYEPRIRVDANEGYSVQTAITTLNKLDQYEIEFVEQPVPSDDLEGMAEVRKNIEIPVMADESVRAPDDVGRIIEAQAADMINIKLMKAGGIRNGVKIASLAAEAGMVCQIGCFIETSVGIAAATHVALAVENIKFADLDGHLFLKQDVIQDFQITHEGINRVSGEPGLGLQIDEEIVKSY